MIGKLNALRPLPAKPSNRRSPFRCLRMESLEYRALLAADILALSSGVEHNSSEAVFIPTIVAGQSPDSPSARLDANNTSSLFTGVGSLIMQKGRSQYICTGTLIDATQFAPNSTDSYVLTAAHCLDSNNDGSIDFKSNGVTFYLNTGEDNGLTNGHSHTVQASALHVSPDFTGFNRPSINDDIAIIKLASPIPDVSAYRLRSTPVERGTAITLVGYGQSGSGDPQGLGYTEGASRYFKRVGGNVIEAFNGDDDGQPDRNEVYFADFDGPNGDGLGNSIETTIGGGDSGGPAFLGNLLATGSPTAPEVVAINTFTYGGGSLPRAPFFGSELGGIMVHPYLTWIQDVIANGGGSGGGDGGGGGGGKGGGKGPPSSRSMEWSAELAPVIESHLTTSSLTTSERRVRDAEILPESDKKSLLVFRIQGNDAPQVAGSGWNFSASSSHTGALSSPDDEAMSPSEYASGVDEVLSTQDFE